MGGAQTNHGRLTAAIAAKFGMKAVIVSVDPYPGEISANLLLDGIMGCDVYLVKEEDRPGMTEDEILSREVGVITAELEAKGEKFDLVILDPPAFTKSRASVKKAVTGYREINLRAMKLIKDGGFLATCSCSHFVDYELFTQTVGQAARNVHKRLRQVEYRTQAPDHPILWGAEDSYYLKFYIFQVCDEK